MNLAGFTAEMSLSHTSGIGLLPLSLPAIASIPRKFDDLEGNVLPIRREDGLLPPRDWESCVGISAWGKAGPRVAPGYASQSALCHALLPCLTV
ncbi:MAG TPA: hypothetical protein VFS89_07510 [Nitrosospira sp.]|nr:hypothetical protein [Nitrosospira sp.]